MKLRSKLRMKSFQAGLQSGNEIFPFVFSEEYSLYRGVEHSLFQLLFYFATVSHPLAVLFCCHYHRSRECLGCRGDGVDVSCREFVVVRELEMTYDLVVAAQIAHQWGVVSYAGEQDESVGVDISWISLREYGLSCVICDRIYPPPVFNQ